MIREKFSGLCKYRLMHLLIRCQIKVLVRSMLHFFIFLLNTLEYSISCTVLNCICYLQYCTLTARIALRHLLRGNLSSLDQPQPRSLYISLLQAPLVRAFVRVVYHSTTVLDEFLGHLYIDRYNR